MLVKNKKLLWNLFRWSNFHQSLLLKFDLEKCRVNCGDNLETKYRKLTAKCYLHSLACLAILWQIAYGEGPVEGKVIAILTSNMLILFTLHLHIPRRKMKDIMEYLNGVLQFDEMYQPEHPKEPSLIEKLNLLFVRYAIFVEFSFPAVFVYGLHWFNPCKPSMVGYKLLSECQAKPAGGPDNFMVAWNVFGRILVFGFNHWLFAFGLSSTVFVANVLHILAILCIRKFVETYDDIARSEKYTSYQKGLVYRHLQLLVLLCNKVLQKGLMVVMIIGPIIICGFCLAMLIRTTSAGTATMSMIFVFFIGQFSTAPCLLQVLGGAHLACKNSKHALQNQKWRTSDLYINNKKFLERKWERKFYKSVDIVKIKFGSDNFIEDQTPLNFWDTSLNFSVQILLMD